MKTVCKNILINEVKFGLAILAGSILTIMLFFVSSNHAYADNQKNRTVSHVELESDGTMIVNGKREFVYGTFRDPSQNWRDFSGVKEAGFNLTHDYYFEDGNWVFPNHTERWKTEASEYLTLAEENEVGVFLGLPRTLIVNEQYAIIEELIMSIKDLPALRFWYLYDEPSYYKGEILPKLKETYQLIKELDPNHPVVIVDAEADRAGKFIEAADLFWIDKYDLPYSFLTAIKEYTDFKERYSDKPAWFVVQANDNLNVVANNNKKLDTVYVRDETYRPGPKEIRAQVHESIALGARGSILYWHPNAWHNLKQRTPQVWKSIVDIGAEIRELSDVLLSDDPVPEVQVSINYWGTGKSDSETSKVLTWKRMYNDSLYIGITHAGYDRRVQVTLTLPYEFEQVVQYPNGKPVVNFNVEGKPIIQHNDIPVAMYDVTRNSLSFIMYEADTVVWRFDFDHDLPAAPTGLKAEPGNQKALLSWNANKETDLSGYNIYQDGVRIASGIPETTYVVDDLLNGVEYAFAVSAIDRSGNESVLSPIIKVTPQENSHIPPNVPIGLRAEPGDRIVKLLWAANTDLELAGYKIYQDGFLIASLDTETDYIIENLVNGREYHFQISSVDSYGNESPKSHSVRGIPVKDGTDILLNGFEVLNEWAFTPSSGPNGKVSHQAATDPKTEGDFSRKVTFNYVKDNGTYFYYKQTYDPSIDMSGASAIIFDVFPTSQTLKENEPLGVLIKNAEGETVFQSILPRMVANRWNKVRIDLTIKDGIVDRNEVRQFNFYTRALGMNLEGRSEIAYYFDNMRLVYPPQESPEEDSNDATLRELTVDGQALEDFTTDRYEYVITLPEAVQQVPVVDAVANDPRAEVVIQQADAIPGTAIVIVTAYDKETVASYRIRFEQSGTEPVQPPATPTGLTAKAGDGAVTLNWTANAEADLAGYSIYQDGNRVASNIKETVYTVHSLMNGKEYTFAISAVNEEGMESALSQAVKATPSAAPSSIASLINLLDRYKASGDLSGSLANQLTNSAKQAAHHLSKGSKDQAAKFMHDFLKHLNKEPMQGKVTQAAKDVLTAEAQAIIIDLTNN